MFEAIILCGGFGSRLKTVSGDIPKPMVLVGGIPFVYRLMMKLEASGCSKILLSLHYRPEYIVKAVNKDKPVSCPVEFVIEHIPLGTGGAIKHAANKISSSKFIVLNGDTYSDISYANFFSYSEEKQITISAVSVEDTRRYGSLEIDSSLNIIAFNEKGRSGPGVINGGSYVVPTMEILYFPKDIFSMEKDFIPSFLGPIKAYCNDGDFVDIGIPADYFYACSKFK